MIIGPGQIKKESAPFKPKAIMVLVDELGEVMSNSNFKLVNSIQGNISSIARLGRAGAVHLCLATQRPSANVISAEVKNNVNAGILLGHFDAGASSLIFDEDISDLAKPEIKGRGYLKTGGINEFQAYWVERSKDFVKKNLSELPKVSQLDAGQTARAASVAPSAGDGQPHEQRGFIDSNPVQGHAQGDVPVKPHPMRRYKVDQKTIEDAIHRAHAPEFKPDIREVHPRRIRSTAELDENGKQPVGIGAIDQDRDDILKALAEARRRAGMELEVPSEVTLPDQPVEREKSLPQRGQQAAINAGQAQGAAGGLKLGGLKLKSQSGEANAGVMQGGGLKIKLGGQAGAPKSQQQAGQQVGNGKTSEKTDDDLPFNILQ